MALAEGSRFFPDLTAAGQARLEALLSSAVPGRLEETGRTLARRPERFPTGTDYPVDVVRCAGGIPGGRSDPLRGRAA